MKIIATLLTGLLTVLLLLSPAGAQNKYLALGDDSDQQIKITANKSLAKNIPDGKEVIFEKAVKVTQEDVTLTCDRLVVVYDEKKGVGGPENRSKRSSRETGTTSDLRSITAIGNVKITQNDRTAIAGKAVFDNVKRTIMLSENPRVWQGGDRMEAPTITIYLDENRIETMPSEGEKNVTVIINPSKYRKEKEKSSPAQGN